jgi:tetratricopeptide (TPR) repeat protein
MESIEKLKEKVDNDPASTLFVPLAEEYRKAGRIGKAIEVLKDGIERQPEYMSARVALGKIYVDKKMTADAKTEFEKVTEAIPGNLFAQRKLADIYSELGEKENAVARYETVLSLNPLDEEAQAILEELRGGKPASPAKAAAVEPEKVSLPKVPPPEVQALRGWYGKEEVAEAQKTLGEEEVSGEPGEPVDEAKVEEMESTLKALSGFEEEAVEAEEAGAQAGAAVAETGGAGDSAVAETAEAGVGKAPDFSEADACIHKEDYIRAMEIYNAQLAVNPDNAVTLQRVQELRALLKLLGRESEIFESGLNSFLNAIKAGRDEFFRSS